MLTYEDHLGKFRKILFVNDMICEESHPPINMRTKITAKSLTMNERVCSWI